MEEKILLNEGVLKMYEKYGAQILLAHFSFRTLGYLAMKNLMKFPSVLKETTPPKNMKK